MATVTLTIPDQHVARVVEALCVTQGYEQTPANAKAAVIDIIKQRVLEYERNESLKAASLAAQANSTDGIVE